MQQTDNPWGNRIKLFTSYQSIYSALLLENIVCTSSMTFFFWFVHENIFSWFHIFSTLIEITTFWIMWSIRVLSWNDSILVWFLRNCWWCATEWENQESCTSFEKSWIKQNMKNSTMKYKLKLELKTIDAKTLHLLKKIN